MFKKKNSAYAEIVLDDSEIEDKNLENNLPDAIPVLKRSGQIKSAMRRNITKRKIPIAGQEITVVERRVDPNKCVASRFNPRISSLLKPQNIKSLVKGISEDGQTHPALGRELEDGTIEIIYGLRRQAATIELGIDLWIEVGDISDELAITAAREENNYEKHSIYELSVFYNNRILDGTYADWNVVQGIEGWSDTTRYRYKALAEIPQEIVALSDKPQRWSTEHAGSYEAILNLHTNSERKKIIKLVLECSQTMPAQIIKSMRKISEKIKPQNNDQSLKTKEPITLKDSEGQKTLKLSISNKGTLKYEILREITKRKQEEIENALKLILDLN